MTREDIIFQHVVRKTLEVFDQKYAGKLPYSPAMRARLINKWLTKERIKVEIFANTLVYINIMTTDHSTLHTGLYEDTCDTIIYHAEMDSIIEALEHSENLWIRQRMIRLKLLASTLLPRQTVFSNDVKAFIVKYACQTGHLKLSHYEKYAQEIQSIVGVGELDGMIGILITTLLR